MSNHVGHLFIHTYYDLVIFFMKCLVNSVPIFWLWIISLFPSDLWELVTYLRYESFVR